MGVKLFVMLRGAGGLLDVRCVTLQMDFMRWHIRHFSNNTEDLLLGCFTLLSWSSLTMFLASSIVWTSRPIGEQNNCAKNCHLRHRWIDHFTVNCKTPVKHLQWEKKRNITWFFSVLVKVRCEKMFSACHEAGEGEHFLLETVSWNTVLVFSSFRQDDDILSEANSTFALSLLKKLAGKASDVVLLCCHTLEPEKNKSCSSYNTTLYIYKGSVIRSRRNAQVYLGQP